MVKISCWFVENGKLKNIHGFWRQFTKIDTVRQTRLHSTDAQVSEADGTGMVKERLSTLTWRLHNDLANSVFDGCSKEVTNNCRVLRDSKSLLQKISENKCHGWIGRGQSILKSSEKYHWKCCDCWRQRFMNHYRMFLANLENLFMKCCKKIDPSILNSTEIIKSILNKGNIALFRNAQAIVHLSCVACVKVSVENVSAWFHGMKNTVILHDSLPSNILWTKWSLLRADLYYIMLLKYLKKQWTSISIKWHFLC